VTRQGRAKKEGRRYPCGRLIREPDRGTPELRAKRLALVGSEHDPRAAFALGILAAQLGWDEEDELIQAGRYYGLLYFRAAAPPHRARSGLGGSYTPGIYDAVKARAAFLAAREALNQRGPAVCRATDAVAVHDWLPHSPAELRCALEGLDTLKRHFRAPHRARESRGRP